MILWHREAQLAIGSKIYHSDDIDIEFFVPFSTENEPDIAEISIYNLSPDSISAIQKGTAVSLSAGYQGDVGMLCSGSVISFVTTIDGVDKKTTLKASTGILPWKEAKVNKTYAKGTTAQAILSDLIPKFGVSIADMTLGKNVTYAKGKTVSGRLKDVAKAIVKETESKFYMTMGRAYIRPFARGTQTGYLLSGETGLLGTPETMEISEGEKPLKQGWQVKCLLNHNIGVDSLIAIRSQAVSGTFRVVKGSHSSDWITDMEVCSV